MPMSEIKRTVLALATILAITTEASANYYDGNRLLEVCTSNDAGLRGICYGYIIGVHDWSGECVTAPGGWNHDTPTGVTGGQVEKVVMLWLQEHPGDLHQSASYLIARALNNAWPCPQ